MATTSRQRKAQSAFASRDSDLSRAVHQSKELAEIAAGKSDFLHGIPPSSSFSSSSSSSFLMGSVACCILGSALSTGVPNHVLFWFLGLVAVSLILYLVAWIDERFKSDFTDFEKSRERWEVENFPDGEIQEMIHIYTDYGISEEDAENVARTLSKYPDFWIDHMLLHEIGILPPAVQRGLGADSTRSHILPFVALVSSFIVPTALICLELTTVAVIASNCQVCILLLIKRTTYQWVTTQTSIGIGMASLVSSLIVHLISRSILSLA